MNINIIDIYTYGADGSVVIQGASQAAIDLLKANYPLHSGTTALLSADAAEVAYALIDAAGLRTRTF